MENHLAIEVPDGQFDAYIVLPQRLPAPPVVILHEVFGVNDDMRETCNELARRGFVAICPDLFWRQQRGVDLDVRSESAWSKGLELYTHIDRKLAVSDVRAVVAKARVLDEASDKAGMMGYCLGALLTFIAAADSDIDAAVAYHGAETEKYLSKVDSIKAPFLMHLAGEDEFMPAAARDAIIDAVRHRSSFTAFTYEGCHHAFSRHRGLNYNAAAAELANERTWAFLAANLT